MKSIRLSLIVYFLCLLAVALGAVSGLVYWNTSTIVQHRKEAMRKVLCTQYERRGQRARDKFDDGLLNQAHTLASMAQFQHQSSRSRLATLAPLGLLSAGPSPYGYLQMPVWMAECTRGPLSYRVYRLSTGEIEFNEGDMPAHPDGPVTEYFQITSEWGNMWHSRTMDYEDHSFPAGPQEFASLAMFESKFDDFEMPMGTRVRRVILKAPVIRFVYRYQGDNRPRPPSSDTSPARALPQPSSPTERIGESTTPAFLIYVAADVTRLNAQLQQFTDERAAEVAHVEDDAAETLSAVRIWLLVVALLTFGATFVGGLFLVRLGLSPLRRLSDAVSRVSEKDMRLQLDDAKVPSELQLIVERLEQTLDQLQRAFHREKQATADISHELRTPLAALLTTADVALRKPRPADEYRQSLIDCRAIGQQLSAQVERLLALARLDAGVDSLRPQEIDAAELAQQCADMVRPLATARDLTLEVHQKGPACLKTDPTKFREVLTNLLHNAIEYNRPQGKVELTVQRDNGKLRVEVSDTGIGIAPEAQKHIFQRFFRADASRTEAGLHAGLGLAIVKGYVDLMGGSISVESVPEKGSTFRLSLPANSSQ